MDNSDKNRVVILEENQADKDLLKTAVEDIGHLAFVFDKETTFFNNFLPIGADLIIFKSASIDKVSRILNTALYLSYHKPIIIISDKSDIRHLITSTPGIHANVLNTLYRPGEIKKTIATLLSEFDPTNLTNNLPVIVGNTPEMIRIREMISGLRYSDDSILIQGEKGTGKELLAKSLHAASMKNSDAFVKANLSDQLFKSVKTDAHKYPLENKKIIPNLGDELFKNNRRGTIYFEAIDTIPTAFQGVLLQCFDEEMPKGVRVIASSNSKIDHLVHKGAFRKDLYFRLNVIKINLPPLRERKIDIPLLADFFVNKFCIESGICHFRISSKIKKALTQYHWPQNVEELEAFVATKNFMKSEEQILDQINAIVEKNKYEYGGDSFNTRIPSEGVIGAPDRVSLKDISKQFSSRIESEILKLVLDKTNWNRKQAAETLAISYKSLLNKIKAYNLN